MSEKKHKPPSRRKYEESNPNWTVRMPLSWHKDYDLYVAKCGLSRKNFMGVSLEKIMLTYEQVRTQAYNEGFAAGHKQGSIDGYSEGERMGYNKGRQEGFEEGKQVGIDLGKSMWAIWYPCLICGRPVFITPLSEEHYLISDFFIDHGWAHLDCAKRMSY